GLQRARVKGRAHSTGDRQTLDLLSCAATLRVDQRQELLRVVVLGGKHLNRPLSRERHEPPKCANRIVSLLHRLPEDKQLLTTQDPRTRLLILGGSRCCGNWINSDQERRGNTASRRV